jgi:DNA primase
MALRQARDAMDVVEDEAQRALLAETLLAETKPPDESEVQSAIQEIHERAIEHQLRELRAAMETAEQSGDRAKADTLALQQIELRNTLRQLHNQRPPER